MYTQTEMKYYTHTYLCAEMCYLLYLTLYLLTFKQNVYLWKRKRTTFYFIFTVCSLMIYMDTNTFKTFYSGILVKLNIIISCCLNVSHKPERSCNDLYINKQLWLKFKFIHVESMNTSAVLFDVSHQQPSKNIN